MITPDVRSAPVAAARLPQGALPSAASSPTVSASTTATTGATASPTRTAPAATTPATPATRALLGAASSRCLTLSGRSSVVIRDCDGGAGQQWTLTQAGEIRNREGVCLDPQNGGTRPGTPVHGQPCSGEADQKWQVGVGGALVGLRSGLCLDVYNGLTGNGTPVQLWPCFSHQSNQTWSLS
ncbi:RICIN domain-containing protein [Kitasatospora sp. NPDC049258]|uniref:RICIN domain-containing protein n=1 Tax=Kitasatospora sp. NPDC049258 TaxID=3155394 RepID=UPI0034146158